MFATADFMILRLMGVLLVGDWVLIAIAAFFVD